MKTKLKTYDFLLIIFLSVLLTSLIILFSAFIVIYDFNFYKNEFSKNNVLDKFDNETYVNLISENLFNYLYSDGFLINIYTYQESSHLKDVKILIRSLILFFLLLFFIFLFALILYNKYLHYVFLITFFILISTLFLLYIFTLFNFLYIFDKFHELFFINNSWIFEYDSILIKLFPEEFFIHAFFKILKYSSFFALISLFSFIYSRKKFK